MKIEKSSYLVACVVLLAGAPLLIFKEQYQIVYDLVQNSVEAPLPVRIFSIFSPTTWLVIILPILAFLFIIKDLTPFAKVLNLILIAILFMFCILFGMVLFVIPIGVVQ